MNNFIELIGFEEITPYAVIIWVEQSGIERFKTVCFSHADLNEMLSRAMSKGDFYASYEPKVIFSVQEQYENEVA